MNQAKLARLAEQVRTGGKGTPRRKKKIVHKGTTADDKKLQGTLKHLGVNVIPQIEEVNLFKDDGNVIHFVNPKVQANVQANTYVISGRAETKKLQDLLPGIIDQLGPANLANLKKIAETLAQQHKEMEKDDEVPELVESFEEVAKESSKEKTQSSTEVSSNSKEETKLEKSKEETKLEKPIEETKIETIKEETKLEKPIEETKIEQEKK